MKYLITFFISTLLLTSKGYAQEQTDEVLLIVIEVDKLMINWSPSNDALGRAIVYRCAECEAETMSFDKDTLLYIKGQPRAINEIGDKVDWTGLVTVTNKTPNKIVKFSIY